MYDLSLSVFFPCYNEEANVERATLAALETCRSITRDFEIIIVDDGSKDRTGELADKLAEQHNRVLAVHNRPNRGYGGALQAGFLAAKKELVFYTDGDGQFDFKELPKLLDLLNEYDIVSAYRINRDDPLIRRINGWGWTMLCNFLLKMKIRDIDCAFKIFPRKLFDEINMGSEGALIDAEILAKATHRGYRIGQVGVHHYPRTAGEQTGANLKVIARAFMELLKLRKHILTERKG
ncbi:MAG: glycosyltransferase family 2 protein [Planctomycetota bacterium]|jgi:glycosyltransferase involved in cell wall biosynthesis